MNPSALLISDTPQGATFRVHVHPRARKTAITGIFGDGADAAVKIALSSPAIEGRANQALVEFLSSLCGVPRPDVTILSGARNRHKVVRIAGRSAAELTPLLTQRLDVGSAL